MFYSRTSLVCRLEAYERNANFGHAQEPEEGFNMSLPPADSYRDINADSKVNILNDPCWHCLQNDNFICACSPDNFGGNIVTADMTLVTVLYGMN